MARAAALDAMNATPPASLDEAVLAINATRENADAIAALGRTEKPQHGKRLVPTFGSGAHADARGRHHTNAEGRPRLAAAAMERTVLNRG